MPAQATKAVFFISRKAIALRVECISNGRVTVEPWQCKAENRRLWDSIAKTQLVAAQLHLQLNFKAQPSGLLLSFFTRNGWTTGGFTEMTDEPVPSH